MGGGGGGGEKGVDVVRKEGGRTGEVGGRHRVAAHLRNGMAALNATCFLNCLVTVERMSGQILKKNAACLRGECAVM